MTVTAITKFVYKGKEFDTLKDIQTHLHNVIGEEVLDAMYKVCPPQRHADFVKLLDLLCKPEIRKILTECLNVEFTKPSEDWHEEGETVNILDIK